MNRYFKPDHSAGGYFGTGAAPASAASTPTAQIRLIPSLRRPPGLVIAVQILLEPVALPLQTFDQVPGLAGSRQVVVLAREDDQFTRNAEVLESAEPLLSLLERHAVVVLRVQDERRRPHVFDILERR